MLICLWFHFLGSSAANHGEATSAPGSLRLPRSHDCRGLYLLRKERHSTSEDVPPRPEIDLAQCCRAPGHPDRRPVRGGSKWRLEFLPAGRGSVSVSGRRLRSLCEHLRLAGSPVTGSKCSFAFKKKTPFSEFWNFETVILCSCQLSF